MSAATKAWAQGILVGLSIGALLAVALLAGDREPTPQDAALATPAATTHGPTLTVLHDEATPATPTATPTPAILPTAAPTATPTPAATPAPTPSPAPTAAPAVVPQTTITEALDPHLMILGWSAIHAGLAPEIVAALDVFPERLQPAMYAIGCAESGWLFTAVGDRDIEGGPSFGWSQIFAPWFRGTTGYTGVVAFPEEWKTDGVGNARGALRIIEVQGLTAWSTWKAGDDHAMTVLAHAHAAGRCRW